MTARKNSYPHQHSSPPKLKHERPKGKTFEETALLVLGLLASVMLGISLFTLNTEEGPLANLKVLLITASASFAASLSGSIPAERRNSAVDGDMARAGVKSSSMSATRTVRRDLDICFTALSDPGQPYSRGHATQSDLSPGRPAAASGA